MMADGSRRRQGRFATSLHFPHYGAALRLRRRAARGSIRLRFRRSDGSNRALARRHTHAESAARPTDAIPFGRLHVAPSARRARGAELGYWLATPAASRAPVARWNLHTRGVEQAPPFLHGAATRSPVHAPPRSPLILTSQKPPRA